MIGNKKTQSVFSVTSEDQSHYVYRDGETLKTPRNLPVAVPTRALADAILRECATQEEKLDLRTMPLTQMTLTAIDISTLHRDEVIDGIMRYGESELVCQRADDPPELVAKQNQIWQTYLDWCGGKFKIELRTGNGIIPFLQKPESLAVLRAHVETYDAFRLNGR